MIRYDVMNFIDFLARASESDAEPKKDASSGNELQIHFGRKYDTRDTGALFVLGNVGYKLLEKMFRIVVDYERKEDELSFDSGRYAARALKTLKMKENHDALSALCQHTSGIGELYEQAREFVKKDEDMTREQLGFVDWDFRKSAENAKRALEDAAEKAITRVEADEGLYSLLRKEAEAYAGQKVALVKLNRNRHGPRAGGIIRISHNFPADLPVFRIIARS